MRNRSAIAALACALGLGLAPLTSAQVLEPRRWTHLPVGFNVLGSGYTYTEGDLFFDPVLRVEDAQVETHSIPLSYVRSFGFLGRAARVDLLLPYVNSRWSGLLDGTPTTVRREGLADPRIRLSTLLVGAPALGPEDFREYASSHPTATVVGAALGVTLPLGEYQEDKLLNLGQNRFIFRPELGVLHTRGPWSFELTGSASLFTDNDDFLVASELEQEPLYGLQAHVVRTLATGWWTSAGAGYSFGARSTIDGVDQDDTRGDLAYGASFGLPIARNQGVKLTYIASRTQKDVGADTDTLLLGWTLQF